MIQFLGNNELMHFGVLGMKWGIRRYQPYSVKPRGSGKGGKEIGEAKKNRGSRIHEKALTKEPIITKDIKKAAKISGSKLYGLENRLKTEQSINRKINTDSIEKKISKESAAKDIKDSVRYTTISDDDVFVKNYTLFKQNLEQKGYKETRCKNYFQLYNEGKVKHKSVQSVFEDPGGFSFEVQFQTPSSQLAKDKKIPLYEERRQPYLPKKRQQELERQMIELAENVSTPKDIDLIKSHG